jgi:1,4-alpha-glucan branching enzyme
MGSEFGQGEEWNYQHSLDWHVLQYPNHQGIKETVKALNHLYREQPALYERAFEPAGFEWLDGGNANDSIMIYIRKGQQPSDDLVVVLNLTPITHHGYRVGVPAKGKWVEIFNSDAQKYWGSGIQNTEQLNSESVSWHGKDNSITISIPPLGAAIFKKITLVPPPYELKR